MRALSTTLLVFACLCAYGQDWGPWTVVFPPAGNAAYDGVVRISFKARPCTTLSDSFYRVENTINTQLTDYVDFVLVIEDCDGKIFDQRVTIRLKDKGLRAELGFSYRGRLVEIKDIRPTYAPRPDLNKRKNEFQEIETKINTSTSVLFSTSHDMPADAQKDLGQRQELLQDRAAQIHRSFNEHLQKEDETAVLNDISELRRIESQYADLETWAKGTVKTEESNKSSSDTNSNNNSDPNSPPPMTQQQIDAADLQNRIESHNQINKSVEQTQKELGQNMVSIMSTDAVSEAFSDLGMGMNFGTHVGAKGVPQVGNTSSSTGAIIPYSKGMNSINMGIAMNLDWWFLRNEFFGVGADGDGFYGFGAFGGGTSSLTTYGYNLKAHGGFEFLKVHVLWGRDYRSGSASNDLDVTSASIGISTNTHAITNSSVDYKATHFGGGFIYDFSDDTERYLSYTLLLERPDFLPASHKAIKVHQLVYRDGFDIIVAYGNNYPLSGKPQFDFKSEGRNQGYFYFGIGKTFTLFKTN